MPNPDTSPAALRALATAMETRSRYAEPKFSGCFIAGAASLRALAAEKEAAPHHDPNLPPGEYVVTVDTVGGAATVNAAPSDAAAITAADALRLLAAEKEAATVKPDCDAPARVLAEWLGYAWDGLPDRDISSQFPDWAPNGIRGREMQGGRPALRRVARDMLAAATVKPDLTVGAHHDPELSPGEYVVAIDTVGGAATVNAPADEATIADLRARLEAAERERDEADASADKWMAQALAELGARCRVETSLSVSVETAAQLLERAEKAEAERDAMPSGGAAAIAAERRRQMEAEGWTLEHDDQHYQGELARAAICYTREREAGYFAEVPAAWPWSRSWWKPKTQRENLVRAGALIAAEIDRLDRASANSEGRAHD